MRTGLCLKQRSPVTDWSGFINRWMEQREETAFVRPYCLEDPAWLAESQKRMRDVVNLQRTHAPLLYDIRDELSVTISANPFDYDFSPQSLAGFRVWLKEQYESLAALNQQWDTDFATWEAVMPFSTDQIKARMVTGERMPKTPPDWSALKQVKFDPAKAAKERVKWNFAPWCDFRSYMDTVLARTLDDLRRTAHEIDPATPVGIEGTQMPHAFGGYDLWKLSQSVDWMEPYDTGNAREILGSFMPGKPLLSTIFEKDTNHALRRLWHLLLLGDKGCMVWWSEECIDASKEDCPLMEKAQALAPALKEMQSPLARLFMRAERQVDPIAIHYSQPSIQVAWLLESTADGKTWPRRFSSFEAQHNRHAAVRNGWLKLVQDLGYTPQFVSTEQIESGWLRENNCRVLVMPDTLASSVDERVQVKDWASTRGKDLWALVSSGNHWCFDGHGTFHPPLEAERHPLLRWQGKIYAGKLIDLEPGEDHPNDSGVAYDMANYSKDRITGAGHESVIGSGFSFIGEPVKPLIQTAPRKCIRTHRYRAGDAYLIAFERNVDYHMSEDLKQAGGNEALEKPVSFEAALTEKAHAYDLRSGAYVGEVDRLPVNLDPWQPSLFALLQEKLPEDAKVVETLLLSVEKKTR